MLRALSKFLMMLASAWLATGCATLFNTRQQCIIITMEQPASVVVNGDTAVRDGLDHHVRVARARAPLQIVCVNDSTAQLYSVKSRWSPAFCLAFYPSMFSIPSIAVDLTNPRRFRYPPHLYIDLADTAGRTFDRVRRFGSERRQSTWVAQATLPWINTFNYLPPGEVTRKTSAGFMGVGAGIGRYYRDNRFWMLHGSLVADFFVPFPAPIYRGGTVESARSTALALAHHHHVYFVTFGYGLTAALNYWHRRYVFDPDHLTPPAPDREVRSIALGAYFDAQVVVRNTVLIGMTMRPTFQRPGVPSKPWAYESVVTLGIGVRVGQ